MTIAAWLARFSTDLSLDTAPVAVVDAATVRIADALGCAIAAAAEPDAPAIEQMIDYGTTDRSTPGATIIGSTTTVGLRSAAMINGLMVRYLDANDIYIPVSGSLSASGHFSDAIPALLSASEAYGASGREFVESVIVAYELQAALASAFNWLDEGFHSVSQVTVAVALAAGRLIGLNEPALAQAGSLAITTGLFLQSWLRADGDVSAIKGGAPGFAAERGICCAELARRGFTGPLDAFETFFLQFGDRSLEVDEAFGNLGSRWTIDRNAIKLAPAQIYTQPVIQGAMELYRQGVRMDQLDAVTVRSNDSACGRVQGSPGAFQPTSREAADHSTPFVAVMALRDGNVSPATYHTRAWEDGSVIQAMQRVKLIVDEKWSRKLNDRGVIGANVEASFRDGGTRSVTVDLFQGHPDNPLTERQMIDKLGAFVGAGHVLGIGSGEDILRRCRALPESRDVTGLVGRWALPDFDRRGTGNPGYAASTSSE